MNHKNEKMEQQGAPSGLEGGRRPTGSPEGASTTEVLPKAQRRCYSAEYKRRIVQEAANCREVGEVGALLRREGIYSSQLSTWRQQYEQGVLQGLGRSRGRRPAAAASRQEVLRLQQENARLKEQLRQAQVIIDVQKKVSALLTGNGTEEPGDPSP